MKVSWNWLKDYVALDMDVAELENRLAMSGLNHEFTEPVADDLQIDLEVTSNRSDCLGQIGVAREISVLWNTPLNVPAPAPQATGPAVDSLAKVSIECPELCPRYTARVISGVKIGPSPDWLANRLRTLGIAVINNVVDITNYVLMECGQPLHAFDFAKIQGNQIVVRESKPGEKFTAIDHKEYELAAGTCVIADANRAIALAGVMGGFDTEVTDTTTDVLIESADFAPLSIRTTARALRLHSDSSYRFERSVDPEGIDWASRRACELILEIAGGSLATGVIDAHPAPKPAKEPVVLRFSQIQRVLGIELDKARVIEILTALGMQQQAADEQTATLISPSWRKDLDREIDLIEEVARIHGYDKIPEDVGVPMAPSHRSDSERTVDRLRHVLTSAGFSEALTLSTTDNKLAEVFSPWTSEPPIQVGTPMLRGADCLRRTLIPSILSIRSINEALSNERIELFETAKVYWPSKTGLPQEERMVTITSGYGFLYLKGVIQQILTALHITASLDVTPLADAFFVPGQGARISIDGQEIGVLGAVSPAGQKKCGLRQSATVAEIKIAELEKRANLVPQFQSLSPYPSVSYDFNFIVDDSVQWAALESTVRSVTSEHLESLRYKETFRDAKRDGAGKKRLLLTITLRSAEQTFTGEQAEEIRTAVVSACQAKHAAQLVA
ncbi:MAG: phenylalanine--tRNA ligase subunit beta [Planctomycetales bacterium]|nr:phenylalanine--tRNA ligase subunit beta [Planctomycetales bacterium]